MYYSLRWELEDQDRTLLDTTKDIVKQTINGIYDFLEFTVETGNDYTDNWLPTLDTSLRVNERNIIEYIYYEKPTTTNTTIRQASAMSENPKIQCLSNDVVRRLLNTKEELPCKYREEVVEQYGNKLLSSGYSREQTKRILINGIKGYMSKLKRRKSDGRKRVHYTAEESRDGRIRKKLIGRTSWYKQKKNNNQKKDGRMNYGRRGNSRALRNGSQDLPTRAVLFMEQTPFGELAGRVKELLHRLEPTLGFKLRVVERTGRSIKSHLSQSACSTGRPSGRELCVTCNQECEDTPDCTRTSVVYENVCTVCNPGATSKGELKNVKDGAPSIYVGETSRSIEERAQEHWGAARRKDEKSHMHKHQQMEHKGEPPKFVFKMVSSHKTALSRQVKEAVRIRRRGGATSILN